MENPRVLTQNGWIEGFTQRGILHFLGVPYASPPVREMRWRPPGPVKGWDEIREAKEFGPRCPQTLGACFQLRENAESEDCLYLNIWTRKGSTKNPVMVWIHGGGFMGGSGSEEGYDGARLAENGATIVTLNYRLGAFGFVAREDIGANFGLQDQIAALCWVRDNIPAFGGDPGNVTVFGESSGAASVRSLLSSPRAVGLFHRAIMQSAGYEPSIKTPQRSFEQAQQTTNRFFQELGTEDVDALRLIPWERVKEASHRIWAVPLPDGQIFTPNNLQWLPVADGDMIFSSGFDGWPENIPVIIGCTRDEARYLVRPTAQYQPGVFETMTKVLGGPVENEILDALNTSESTDYERLERLYTEALFTEPCLASLRDFSKHGRRAYAYHFTRSSPGATESCQFAEHTGEMSYVFGNLHVKEQSYYDSIDTKLSEVIQHAWLSFARSGEPQLKDGTAWPVFEAESLSTMWFGDVPERREFPISKLVSILENARIELESGEN